MMTNTIYQEKHKLASALKHVFGGLTSTNLSKSPCMIHLNTLLL